MSRYIDADALINKLDERCDAICQWTKKEREVMCGACPLATAFDEVENFPTADVAPVVHGKWIPMADADKDNNQLFQCSNCSGGDLHAVGVEVPFCWKCGARMDLQDREEKQ